MIRAFCPTLLFLLLSGCAPAIHPSPEGSSPSSTSVPLTPTASAAPVSVEPPTKPAAPEPGCGERRGTVVSATLTDPQLAVGLHYSIYLPPCYFPVGKSVYPALYLLHGLGADHSQWGELGLDEALDELIRAGQVRPFMVVMPWGRSGVDLEPVIVEGLIPHIDSTYATRVGRGGRAIGGLSRGAAWAFRIGLKHPELFAAVGLHSPATTGADRVNLPFWLRGVEPWALPRLWIDIGERDPLLPEAEELKALLEQYGVSHVWHQNPGTHEAVYWSGNLNSYLLWYADSWKEPQLAPGNRPE